VNHLGEYGRWRYVVVEDPQKLGSAIDAVSASGWDSEYIEPSRG
jgi:hypothetical protein